MHCTRDEFAQLAIRVVSELGYCRVTSYDESKFALTFKQRNGLDGFLQLANVYQSYCAAPEAERLLVLRAFCVDHFENGSASTEIEEAAPRLVPFLKHRFSIERVHLELALAQDQFAGRTAEQLAAWQIPYIPIAEHYALGLIYDDARTETVVRQDLLTAWDMTFQEGLALAFANLREISDHPFELAAPGVYTGSSRAEHNPAKILLTDLIMALPLKGQPVVIIPHRNQFVIAGSEDIAGLKIMLKMVKELINSPDGVLTLPIILENNIWLPFSVHGDHELFAEFDGLRLSAMSAMYGEQKELLDKLNGQNAEQVFVAAYQGRKWKDQVFSQAVIAQDALPSLLPLADTLEFGRIDPETDGWKTMSAARLDKCVSVIADLLIPMGMYPERCRIETFPSKKQIHQMGLDNFKQQTAGFVAPPTDDPRRIIEEVLMLPVCPNSRPMGDSKEHQGTFSMDFICTDSVAEVAKFYFSALNKTVSLTSFNQNQSQFQVARDLNDRVQQLMDDMLKDHFRGRGPRASNPMPTPETFFLIDESQSASRTVSITRAQGNASVVSLTKKTYSPDLAKARSIIPVTDPQALQRFLGISIHASAKPEGPLVKDASSVSQLFGVLGATISEVTKFYLDDLKQASHLQSISEQCLVEAISQTESKSVLIGKGANREVFILASRRMIGNVKPQDAKTAQLEDLEKHLQTEIYPGSMPEDKLSKKRGSTEQRFTTRDTALAVSRYYRFVLDNPIYVPLPDCEPTCYFIFSLAGRDKHAILIMAGQRTQFVIRTFR